MCLTIIEPARRHKCEVCLGVFECHLCTIEKEHPMHSGRRIEHLEDPTISVYVCEECCVEDNQRFVICNPTNSIRLKVKKYWDYLTGKVVVR